MDVHETNMKRGRRRAAALTAAMAAGTVGVLLWAAPVAGAVGNPSDPPAVPQTTGPQAPAAVSPVNGCNAVFSKNPNASVETYRNSSVGSANFYVVGRALCPAG